MKEMTFFEKIELLQYACILLYQDMRATLARPQARKGTDIFN